MSNLSKIKKRPCGSAVAGERKRGGHWSGLRGMQAWFVLFVYFLWIVLRSPNTCSKIVVKLCQPQAYGANFKPVNFHLHKQPFGQHSIDAHPCKIMKNIKKCKWLQILRYRLGFFARKEWWSDWLLTMIENVFSPVFSIPEVPFYLFI